MWFKVKRKRNEMRKLSVWGKTNHRSAAVRGRAPGVPPLTR